MTTPTPTEVSREDIARIRKEFEFVMKLTGDPTERLSVSLGEGLALLAMAERAASTEALESALWELIPTRGGTSTRSLMITMENRDDPAERAVRVGHVVGTALLSTLERFVEKAEGAQ